MNTKSFRITDCLCGVPLEPGCNRCPDCQADYDASPPDVRAMYDYFVAGMTDEYIDGQVENMWADYEAAALEAEIDAEEKSRRARRTSRPTIEAFGRQLKLSTKRYPTGRGEA